METRSVYPIALGNYSGVVQDGRIAIAQKYNVSLLTDNLPVTMKLPLQL